MPFLRIECAFGDLAQGLAFVAVLSGALFLGGPAIAQNAAPEAAEAQAEAAAAPAAASGQVAVTVENKSEPVLCAEKDNVSLTFTHPKVTRFRIEAVHPVYINALMKDSFAADWTACDFAEDVKAQPPPRKVTLYEDVELWVVGYTFPNFWRDRKVPFRVGDRVDDSLHLIQVWVRHEERAEEVLVLYPTDGYWRARPLPPKHLGWSAYGSSFLVGPVEDAGRPVVNFSKVGFDPQARRFDFEFAGGGDGSLSIAALTREAQVIDVAFDQPIGGPPFAALRSMYITRFNNDVAEVAVQEEGATSWREEPVMGFTGSATAREVWTGRHTLSRHNTSSPDTVFRDFTADAPAEP